MTLPNELQSAIEQLLSGCSLKDLTKATQNLSERYRRQDSITSGPLLTNDAHRLAYLTMRLPATYEAIYAVMRELGKRVAQLVPRSLLDVGAGPGTGMWAALSAFDSLEDVTLLEQDSSFVAFGKKLGQGKAVTANWIMRDITQPEPFPENDLVLLSYSIGELDSRKTEEVLKRSWDAAQSALVVIEPGTPRGYETILKVREKLVGWGGRLVAPCPHEQKCPMEGTRDWCHFPCRVPRTSAHRHVKEATLGHEDEKFSYVIFTKDLGHCVYDRIVRHPLRKSGHVHMELCSRDSLKQVIVSKKQGELYQWAKKADWGDGR